MNIAIADIEKEKQAARQRLRDLRAKCTYDKLTELTGLNRKELNYLIRFDDYDPGPVIWHRLGVTVYELAPVCPVHGKACVLDCSTERPTKKPGSLPKRNRASINLDDMQSAADTITAKLQDDPEKIYQLIDALEVYMYKYHY